MDLLSTRRAFLQILGATAATAVFDPEFLLWKPGAKTIFIPAPSTTVGLPFGQLLRVGDVVELWKNGHPYLKVDPITRLVIPGAMQQFVVTSVGGSTAIVTPAIEEHPRRKLALVQWAPPVHRGRHGY